MIASLDLVVQLNLHVHDQTIMAGLASRFNRRLGVFSNFGGI
jgi:hypothetical protein